MSIHVINGQMYKHKCEHWISHLQNDFPELPKFSFVVSLGLQSYLHLENPLLAKGLDGFDLSSTVHKQSSNERNITTREKSLGRV